MTKVEHMSAELLLLLAKAVKTQIESQLHGDNADLYFRDGLKPLEDLILKIENEILAETLIDD